MFIFHLLLACREHGSSCAYIGATKHHQIACAHIWHENWRAIEQRSTQFAKYANSTLYYHEKIKSHETDTKIYKRLQKNNRLSC